MGILVSHSKDPNIGEIIDDALTLIEKEKCLIKERFAKKL